MRVQRSRRAGEGSLPWIAASGHPLNRETFPAPGRLSTSSDQRLYSSRSLTYGKLARYCIAKTLPATDLNIDIRQTAASMSPLPHTMAHSVTITVAAQDDGAAVSDGTCECRLPAPPGLILREKPSARPRERCPASGPGRRRRSRAGGAVSRGRGVDSAATCAGDLSIGKVRQNPILSCLQPVRRCER